jgi:hypothetical protein
MDTSSLTDVLQLAQVCEDLARAALGVSQGQLRTKVIAQDVFDRAFQDYGLAMQKARDMYYQASHGLAQQLISSGDLRTLAAETAALKASLASLQRTEHVLSISLGVVTVVGAVATAVVTPSAATLQGALSEATKLKQAILG